MVRTSILLWGLVLVAVVPAWGEEVRIGAVAGGGVEVRGFMVERAGEVEVEAVELVMGMAGVSRTWILDAGKRTVVWEMGRGKAVAQSRRTSVYRERVRLGAGAYELYYSLREGVGHEAADPVEGFVRALAGASVPAELLGELGVTVKGAVRPLGVGGLERLRAERRGELLVDLSGLGDDVWEVRGFALGAPAEVEVYSLGEVRQSGGSDVGWIVDADDGRTVWELTWEGSEPAGGREENRLARVRLPLPAGRYAAWFVTDGGLSAEGWYGAPPYDPSGWGMTVRCVDGCGGAAAIEYEHLPRRLVAAELTGFGDRERRELPFSVDAPTADRSVRLRVYAVGEGIGGRMFDYGWIEDAATGERVWSMESDHSHPAGGSAKNRVVDEPVELAPGRYRAVFETDGSHSTGGGWNARPPAEPERWGLTILIPETGMGVDRRRRETVDPRAE